MANGKKPLKEKEVIETKSISTYRDLPVTVSLYWRPWFDNIHLSFMVCDRHPNRYLPLIKNTLL